MGGRAQLGLLLALLLVAGTASAASLAQDEPIHDGCANPLPSPRVFWTLYAAPPDRMWVPFQGKGGPFVPAEVGLKYDQTWYIATLDEQGRIQRAAQPPWPRPDLLQLAGAGLQASRSGTPACGRPAGPTVPPCYVEMVYPLVFLDRLSPDGPELRQVSFRTHATLVHPDRVGGGPSRMGPARYSDQECPVDTPLRVLGAPRTTYLNVGGCASMPLRVDTCYAAGG